MQKWLPYLIVGSLLLGGLLVSAFYSPVWYDDAGHFLVAQQVAEGNGMCYPLDSGGENCVPDSPFITMGPVLTYPIGGWLAVFGNSMLVGRMCMVLLTLLAMLAFFLVGRRLTNSFKALVAVGLMGVNIQFLTYGAEVLGEVPMMGFVLGGMACFLAWQKSGAKKWAALGMICWCLAVGIKEYAILPLGLSLLVWWLWALVKGVGHVRIFNLGLAFAFALALTLSLIHRGPMGAFYHFVGRASYGSEFLALNFGISLKFLLFKPLFWLGMIAMVIKRRVKKRPEEVFVISMQLAWLVFFLLSAGYDRFGFLLLFLPAIYVAEFVPYIWKEAGRKREWAWLRRTIMVVIAFVLFSQQTFWVFGKRVLFPDSVNAIEKAAFSMTKRLHPHTVVTAEQQMALFFQGSPHDFRLIGIVPSQGENCVLPHPYFNLRPEEIFLAGPYAFTEYEKCIDWAAMEAVDSVQVGEEKWVIYGVRNRLGYKR